MWAYSGPILYNRDCVLLETVCQILPNATRLHVSTMTLPMLLPVSRLGHLREVRLTFDSERMYEERQRHRVNLSGLKAAVKILKLENIVLDKSSFPNIKFALESLSITCRNEISPSLWALLPYLPQLEVGRPVLANFPNNIYSLLGGLKAADLLDSLSILELLQAISACVDPASATLSPSGQLHSSHWRDLVTSDDRQCKSALRTEPSLPCRICLWAGLNAVRCSIWMTLLGLP